MTAILVATTRHPLKAMERARFVSQLFAILVLAFSTATDAVFSCHPVKAFRSSRVAECCFYEKSFSVDESRLYESRANKTSST